MKGATELSDIEIAGADITDTNVDAIENAANDGLSAGGDVCGPLFEAINYR